MALDPAGVQLVAQDANQFFGDMDRASRAVNDFGDTTEKAGKGIGAFGEMAIGAFRRAGEMALNFAMEAGQALVGFLSDSVAVAGDFESGMNRFGAAVGDIDAGGLEEFRDLFLDIGKELPVSTADVQDAAIALVKGGLDPAILAAGGLKDAIQFAAAAELDLVAAAEIGVKQLGVWIDASASAEEQTAFLAMSQDILVKAAGASTLNVDNLAAAMNVAAGQAKAAGLDYEDFATGITLISPAFNSAQEAGTAFKNFLARLQPSTAPATEAMQDLGLMTTNTTKIMDFLVSHGIQPLGTDLDTLGNQFTEFAAAQSFTQAQTDKLWGSFSSSVFFDAAGEFVGVAEAAELLQGATENLTDADRLRTLQTIFGNDAMGAAAMLAENGAEGYALLAQKMEDAAGVQAVAAAKQKGFNTALDNAKGSIEAMQITIGSYLLPVLAELLNDYIAPGINAITDFADRIFAASDPVAALIGEIDQLIPGFAGVVDTVQEVVNWFTTASDETSVLAQQAGDLAGGALQFLTKAWNEDVLPAIQIVSAFFVNDILPILSDLAETILPILNASLQVAAGFWDNVLVPALKLAWNMITTFVVPILKEVTGWLKENLPPAVQMVADFLTGTLFPALGKVYDFLSVNVVPILAVLADVALATVGKGLEALAGLWENVLSPALDDLWEFVDQNIIPVLEDFAEWLGAATGGMEGITGAIKTAVDWLSDLADSIANLELPDWLTPGSPTPLELGLLGIADALRDVVSGGNLFGASLDDINSALQMTSGLVADAFGGQADMFQQQESNLERLEGLRGDLSAMDFAVLETSLDRALSESQQFADPKQAAEYYDLQSRYAFKLADLRSELAETEDRDARERIFERIRLTEKAQAAELAGFQERARTADNPYGQLQEQIQAIFDSMEITGDMPPEIMALFNTLTQLLGAAPPPAASGQQMAGMTNNYYGQVGSNFPMSLFTNNSPAAMFQSYQMMQAMAAWGA